MNTIEALARTADEQIDALAGDYYGDRTGCCDRVNGILALAAHRIGHVVQVVTGAVDGEAHTWAIVDDINVDVAGEQFGLPRVQTFAANARYTVDATFSAEDAPTEMYEEDEAIVDAIVAASTVLV